MFDRKATPAERRICRIVGTPIGNLSDMSERAIAALRGADVIFAEDTRTARGLLAHLDIKKELHSYHKDNELAASEQVLETIAAGKSVALISEAGMPAISDPGYVLIRRLLEQGIPHEVIPCASAAVLAAVSSGLCENGRYLFYGFLSHKTSEAEAELVRLSTASYPIVLYEAPHRLKRTLEVLLKYFEPPMAVCRELTKIYEEVVFVSSAEDNRTSSASASLVL
ncbi:ribosomal RNA small subunit methyltransferase I [Deferribacterales bacterium RsTz2092]